MCGQTENLKSMLPLSFFMIAAASVALYWLGILCTVTALYRTLYQIDQLLTGNAATATFFWVGLYFVSVGGVDEGRDPLFD